MSFDKQGFGIIFKDLLTFDQNQLSSWQLFEVIVFLSIVLP